MTSFSGGSALNGVSKNLCAMGPEYHSAVAVSGLTNGKSPLKGSSATPLPTRHTSDRCGCMPLFPTPSSRHGSISAAKSFKEIGSNEKMA